MLGREGCPPAHLRSSRGADPPECRTGYRTCEAGYRAVFPGVAVAKVFIGVRGCLSKLKLEHQTRFGRRVGLVRVGAWRLLGRRADCEMAGRRRMMRCRMSGGWALGHRAAHAPRGMVHADGIIFLPRKPGTVEPLKKSGVAARRPRKGLGQSRLRPPAADSAWDSPGLSLNLWGECDFSTAPQSRLRPPAADSACVSSRFPFLRLRISNVDCESAYYTVVSE